MSEEPKIGAELLNDIALKITAKAQEHGLSVDSARLLGVETAAKLADDWGGQLVYVPKDAAQKIKVRNAQIYREFTGNNVQELAAKYGLGIHAVYRLIEGERRRRAQTQEQATLFS